MAQSTSSRLPWVDHLRTLVIVLVVNMHACVTYSHVGDWYVKSAAEPSMAAKIPFIVWQGHLQSFFMGLLFFLSGYFAAGSLARRGPAGFVRERLVRLGLPALFYMLAIHPFILLGLNPWHYRWPPITVFFADYLSSGRFLRSSGPLWFAVALFLFCVAAAAWCSVRRSVAAPAASVSSGPSATTLWAVGIGLGVTTFAVRLVQPIGTNVMNLQLCFFPQYIVFFVAGLHAARHGWLLPLAQSRRARMAGWLALLGGPVVMLGVLAAGARSGSIEQFMGGWHGAAFALAMWEQLAGVGLSLGLLAWFSRHADVERPALRWLSDRSFGVYVLHAPVLVGLFMLYRSLPQHVYGLIALLTLTGLIVSFALVDLARRVRGTIVPRSKF